MVYFHINYSPETIEFLREVLVKTKNPTDKEKIKRLFFSINGIYLFKKTVGIEDKIATFKSRAKVKIDEKTVPFYELQPLISRSNDYSVRDKYGKEYIRVVKKTINLEQKIIETISITIKKELGFDGYIDYCQRMKKVNYYEFAEKIDEFTFITEKLYRRETTNLVKSLMNKKISGIPFWHLFYLRKRPFLDQYFPKNQLLSSVNKTLSGLGINLTRYKNIHIDIKPRPKKYPRPYCYWSKVPQEIHLIIKPIGGIIDYENFFHELGHALHYGLTNPKLDFEFRYLSRSNALTETYAFLMENLCYNPIWLKEIMGLNKKEINKIVYYSLLLDFIFMRRNTVKFLYELEMFKKSAIKDGGKIYAEKLSNLTGFIYYPENYLNDTDPEFYSVDYLRAWIANAQLENYLIKKFGEDWFTKKQTGDFLKNLWSWGDLYSLEEVLKKVGCKKTDPKYLLNKYQSLSKLAKLI